MKIEQLKWNGWNKEWENGNWTVGRNKTDVRANERQMNENWRGNKNLTDKTKNEKAMKIRGWNVYREKKIKEK